MKKTLLALLALTSISAFGAAGDVIFKQINPSGTAITDRVQANPSAIRVYGLNSDAGTWKPTQFALGTGFSVAGAFGSQTLNFTEAGIGTVTSVAVGDLSPIFTSSVADPTTAASVSFTLTDAGQSTFLAGPIIGPGAPSYRPIGVADLPTIPNSSLQNFAITIAGTSTALGGSISRDTITGVSSNGIVARTAANTLTNRTITGTANEVTITNGDGVAGNPTASLPAAITLTGKTVTGGTFAGGAFNGTVGATTPSTGMFTTASTVSGSVTGTWAADGSNGLVNYNTGNSSHYHRFQLNSSTVASITSTGLNSTAIGATTPSMGAFTTVSATSDLYSSTALAVTGNGHSLTGASRLVIDNNAGTTRFYAYGPNATTGGSFEWHSIASDGSPDATILSLNSTGLTVTQQDSESLSVGRASTDGTIVGIRHGASFVGSISATSTATAYNTSSDRRLKTNIRDFTGSEAIIDAIKPRIYDWKTGEKDTVGFVAQELHAVYPAAVTKGDDGDEITQQWAVDYSKLVPVLVAEIQALRARVDALEAAK